ncbi:GAP family protein [Mycobacterium sp. HUMS_1102779]|uniref:GAP family protein n=1 Tax=Mycobacterium sp. HUMS_1102779 TaxID=3383487 RepID=UPI00389A68DD
MEPFGPSGLLVAKLAAPALVVALSPVPVVLALVLLVHNDRPRSSSIAYLLGRLLSLTGLTVASMRIPRVFDGLRGPAPPWTDWLVVAAGAALVAFGAWVWRRRAAAADEAGWDSRAGRITPAVAAAIGTFPMLANPKVLAASAAAGTQIAAGRLPVLGAAAAVACYAALATSTVAAPVLAYVVAGPRIDRRLEQIRRWIQRRRHAMTATTLVAGGCALVLYGFA